MAEVYLANRRSSEGKLGPDLAIKRLLPHLKSNPLFTRMFFNEARITAQIHHPNVVEVFDMGRIDGEPFIAMELLSGLTFTDLRQKAAEEGRRIPLSISLRILSEACKGLDAAHRVVDDGGNLLSIVHRDFNPENIHVGTAGEIKVIDFGIARAENIHSGTEPGTLKGKYFYMSPEMISGAQVDHRSDLFAAGVMLYEQMCGHRPFTATKVEDLLRRISEAKVKKPSEIDPSVPVALERICLTALAKDPKDRFPSLREFVVALQNVGEMAPLASAEEVSGYLRSIRRGSEANLPAPAVAKGRSAQNRFDRLQWGWLWALVPALMIGLGVVWILLLKSRQ